MGTKYFPSAEIWEDSIIAMEHCNVYGSKLAGLHELRAFAAAGAFDKAKAIVTGPLDCDSEETLLQVQDISIILIHSFKVKVAHTPFPPPGLSTPGTSPEVR